MMALVLLEAKVAMRRAAWPVALALYAGTGALFLGVWGATSGIPLWRATILDQLAAADRVTMSIVFTWLCGYVLSDGPDGSRQCAEWSALTGRPPETVFRARVGGAAILSFICTVAAVPTSVAAAIESAATASHITAHLAGTAAFGLFCVGTSAIASVAFQRRITAWASAMVAGTIGAVGVHLLHSTAFRIGAPSATGALGILAATAIVRRRFSRAA